MSFAKSIFVITKHPDKDEDILAEAKNLMDFANAHDISVELAYNGSGNLICTVDVEGKTSMYCRGCVAEIKNMLEEAFNCKLKTLLTAY